MSAPKKHPKITLPGQRKVQGLKKAFQQVKDDMAKIHVASLSDGKGRP